MHSDSLYFDCKCIACILRHENRYYNLRSHEFKLGKKTQGEKNRWHKRVPNPGPLDPESYALPLRHTGLHCSLAGLKMAETGHHTVDFTTQ